MAITSLPMIDAGVNLANKGWVTKQYVMSVYPGLLLNYRSAGLWGWGANGSGQLGDNTIVNKSSPVQIMVDNVGWVQAACGSNDIGIIKIDGTLWMCGNNYSGKLGDNTTIARSSPVQTIAGGSNWIQIACGAYHTAGVKADGTLWCWGANANGQLGDNTPTARSSPVQTITGGSNWAQVACGYYYHTAAVKTDGTLWCWGSNAYGQLGDNTITLRRSPVQTIAGGSNWLQVACGRNHTAAIKIDGTLWCWGGFNGNGALGDGTTVNKSSPVQTVAGGSNWIQVACGYRHTIALKTDGSLWGWGYSGWGQLGVSISSVLSPIQIIAGSTNWIKIACGSDQTAGIKTDGTLWSCGRNNYGQLGDNTAATSRNSPVQTVIFDGRWKSVVCFNSVLAIRDSNY